MLETMRWVLALAVCLGATGAQAEMPEKQLNLWVSHYFAGIDTYDAGDYSNALKLYAASMQDAQRKHRSAETAAGLGRACTALGNFDEAERHYREALALKRESLGKRNPQLASTLNDLADLLYLMEKPAEVEGLYREALELQERDQFSLDVARALNGLALVHNDAGAIVEAEELLKRAATVHDKGQRRNHPFAATVQTNLGILYTHLGRLDEAEAALTTAKFIQDDKLRADHPDVAVRLQATASLRHAQGKGGEAARLAAEAESIRQKQSAKGDLY